MRRHILLSFILACDTGRPVIFEPASTSEATDASTGVGSTSTGTPTTGSGETTGGACLPVGDAGQQDIAAVCAAHPYEQPGCPGNLGKTCEEMLGKVASLRACADVTLCDYEACAESLGKVACGEWPAECAATFACTTTAG